MAAPPRSQMDGARIDIPRVLSASCLTCPPSMQPDEFVDCKALWHTLVDVTGRPKFSSRVTARGLAKMFSLNNFLLPTALLSSTPFLSNQEGEGNRSPKRRRTGEHDRKCRVPDKVAAIIHRDVSMTEAEGRGREWVCDCKDGFPAGTCVLIEQPLVSVLDAETQREREWWGQPSADTCALFCEWMAAYANAVEESVSGNPPSAEASGDRSILVELTSVLHPAPPPGGSSAEDWEELRSTIPPDAQALFDRVVEVDKRNSDGGGNHELDGTAHAAPAGSRAARADLPAVWRALELNQMGSYSHTEHQAGGYERLWRYFTGTGCYPMASVGFNHACTPNVLRVGVGPTLFFRTSRFVPYGEPLTISYVGTDVLREPLDVRVGEQGGGLSGRDFVCGCALCEEERSKRVSGEEGDGVREVVVELPREVKGQIRLAGVEERVATIEALLRGEGISVDGGEDEDEEGAAGGGALAPRLMKKERLELELEAGFSMLEAGWYDAAGAAFARIRSETMRECLPLDTVDELEASVDLYLLAARVAAETRGPGNAGAQSTESSGAAEGRGGKDAREAEEGGGGERRRRRAGGGLSINAGAGPAVHSQAVEVVEAMQRAYGARGAQAGLMEPSVHRTELCYVCSKMVADGDAVMAAAWRSLVDASSVVWGNEWWSGQGKVWYGHGESGAEAAKDARVEEIARRDAKDVSEGRFWREYMLPNIPLILHNAAVDKWRISKEWVRSDGAVDAGAVRAACGQCKVTVHDCSNRIAGYDTMPTREMTVAEYLAWWQGPRRSTEGKEELLYLKDWNLTKDERFSDLYEWPEWFRQDWLNLYEQTTTYDHRFVYLGPQGSFTPLHRDTLHSFSWSANVAGRKRWWMLPPECTSALLDAAGNPMSDIRNADDGSSPAFEAAARPKMVVVEQGPGEIMFVPSGWWHQVENITDCLSVNHNWLNAANIEHSWALLQEQREKVAADCPKEQDEIVLQVCQWCWRGARGLSLTGARAQDVLQFRIGWHFASFHAFLCHILEHEIEAAKTTLARRDAGDDVAESLSLARLGLGRVRGILSELHRSEAFAIAESGWRTPELPQMHYLISILDAALERHDTEERHSDRRDEGATGNASAQGVLR